MFGLAYVTAMKAVGNTEKERRQRTARVPWSAGVISICSAVDNRSVQVQCSGVVAGKVGTRFKRVMPVSLGEYSTELPDVRRLRVVYLGGAVGAWVEVSDEPIDGDVWDQGRTTDKIAGKVR